MTIFYSKGTRKQTVELRYPKGTTISPGISWWEKEKAGSLVSAGAQLVSQKEMYNLSDNFVGETGAESKRGAYLAWDY